MRIHVLMLFGGESPEHDVSLASAHNVFAALDESKYEVSLGYITKKGEWRLVESIDDRQSYRRLTPVLGDKQFEVSDGSPIQPDVLLPILHGTHGEDGDVQGLANLMHLPCVGPSLASACITMDKELTKDLVKLAGVPVVDWLSWHVTDPKPMYDNAIAKLGKKLFIKPSKAGSSVGASIVTDETQFIPALDLAARYDDFVLIETDIDPREIEVAVLGNTHAQVSKGGEIVPGEEFYSYDDKYNATSAAEVIIPAQIDPETAELIMQYSHKAYRAVRGHGMARIDFFVTTENEVYLNEINSIPGFTNISMYPKLWRDEGLSYPELLDRLIELALE